MMPSSQPGFISGTDDSKSAVYIPEPEPRDQRHHGVGQHVTDDDAGATRPLEMGHLDVARKKYRHCNDRAGLPGPATVAIP